MLFAEEAARIIAKKLKQPVTKIINHLEKPPSPELGDLALPCFFLAKEEKKNPAKIAEELEKELEASKPIKEFKATGPYLNIFFDQTEYSKTVLTNKISYPKRKEKVMIEHSNGNTHKQAHIGHIRNMTLGDSLVRLMRTAGYRVVNAYYINDTGSHVARCLWALIKKHQGEEPPKEKKLEWLGKAYIEGTEASEDPENKKEIEEILKKLEEGEPEITNLWKKTREWSIEDWHRIFEQLELLPFDAKFYDSEVIKGAKEIVKEMRKKGIIKESEGALIADLEEYGLGVVIIEKSSGTIPYITKDLALAKEKFEKYNIDQSVYVVASEQEMHFKQLFKLLELYGFKQAKQCYHLSYELVMLSTGKMSSRKGNIITFDELYQEVYEKAQQEVKKRHEDWTEKKIEKTTKAITLAAIKFPFLLQEPNKRLIFDIDKALDFEGETGPYLQYTHARLCSVLKKHGKKVSENINYELLTSIEEKKLIRLLSEETEIVSESAEKYRPTNIARYALEIAQTANEFYHSKNVLKAEEETKKARLLLVLKTKEALARMMEIIGITPLEEM